MELEHISFVSSWWLMLCIICAMCFIMFLEKMGISIGFKSKDQ
ncbi:MAG TPA: hypothetical protein VLJ17_24720 [Xanthobacteraceae bacterium]|nr:hypothetical protein [Xanthobacteraceae bacterium]